MGVLRGTGMCFAHFQMYFFKKDFNKDKDPYVNLFIEHRTCETQP